MNGVRAYLWPVYVPTLLFAVGQGAVLPILAVVATERGAGLALAGAVVALRGIASMLTSLPAAVLVSRFGEVRTVAGATVLLVIASAVAWLGQDLWSYAAAVLCLGASWSVWLLARLTFVSDSAPDHVRGRSLSVLGGTNRIGNVVGPLVSAGLIAAFGSEVAFVLLIVAAVLGAALFIGADRRLDATRGRVARSPRAPMGRVFAQNRRALATAGTGAFWISALRAARDVVLPLIGAGIGLDATQISLAYGLSVGCELALFYTAGAVSDRFGRRWVSIPCLLGLSLALVAFPLWGSVGAFLAVSAGYGLANGFGSGIVMTMGSDFSPAEGGAEFLGLWRVVAEGGSAAGPVLVSGLSAVAGLGAASTTLGVVGVAAAVFVAVVVPESRHLRTPTA